MKCYIYTYIYIFIYIYLYNCLYIDVCLDKISLLLSLSLSLSLYQTYFYSNKPAFKFKLVCAIIKKSKYLFKILNFCKKKTCFYVFMSFLYICVYVCVCVWVFFFLTSVHLSLEFKTMSWVCCLSTVIDADKIMMLLMIHPTRRGSRNKHGNAVFNYNQKMQPCNW